MQVESNMILAKLEELKEALKESAATMAEQKDWYGAMIYEESADGVRMAVDLVEGIIKESSK